MCKTILSQNYEFLLIYLLALFVGFQKKYTFVSFRVVLKILILIF